jgi:hypothetical protein
MTPGLENRPIVLTSRLVYLAVFDGAVIPRYLEGIGDAACPVQASRFGLAP